MRARAARLPPTARALSASPAPPPTAAARPRRHRYQEPKPPLDRDHGGSGDGALRFDCAAVEAHLRRRTSFVGPESLLAADMQRAPALGGAGASAAGGKSGAAAGAGTGVAPGAAIVAWLEEKRGCDRAAALATAQRMAALGHLVPNGGGPPVFVAADKVVWRFVPKPPVSAN